MIRRRIATIVLCLCTWLALGASAPTAVEIASPADWTQFRLNDANNAVLGGSLYASWRITTGGAYSSSPTIAGGVLYAGDNRGTLSAIDPASGKRLWSYKLANPIMSAPIVYGDAVIVGEGNENSPQGSSPSHPIRVGNPPNALLAFNRQTGALLWRVHLPGSGMPTPAVIDGVLVHHNGAGYVYGIDPKSGSVLYDRNLHSIASMVAALPISPGRFATTGVDANAVWMLDAKTGSVVWQSNLAPIASGVGDCPPVSDGSRIYCNYIMPPSSAVPVQTQREAKMHAYAIDVQTGKRVWDREIDDGILPIRNEAAIPLLANNMLYMGASLSPYMHALDPRTGNVVWETRVHGAVKGGIVDDDGVLYFGDHSGYLWALDARSGKVLGVKNMHTCFNVGSPMVAGQTLIIGSKGGSLFAVPLAQIRSAHDR